MPESPAADPGPDATSLSAEEALRRAGARAVLSHESAADLLGIELLKPGSKQLTVPRNRSRLALPGWQVARADVAAGDRLTVDGVPCTAAARTVLDLSRELPFDEAVVAADSSLRIRLVSEADLTSRLSAAWGRGAAAARAVSAALDAGAGSILESLLRLVLRQAGLSPVTQYVVRDHDRTFVARVDFCFPAARLVVEADGFAFHADRVAYRRDRDRLNALERLGWRVLRFTWEDVRGRPEHVIELVRECLAATAA